MIAHDQRVTFHDRNSNRVPELTGAAAGAAPGADEGAAQIEDIDPVAVLVVGTFGNEHLVSGDGDAIGAGPGIVPLNSEMPVHRAGTIENDHIAVDIVKDIEISRTVGVDIRGRRIPGKVVVIRHFPGGLVIALQVENLQVRTRGVEIADIEAVAGDNQPERVQTRRKIPFFNKNPVGGEFLDAAVVHVRNIHIAAAVQGNTGRMIEQAIGRAMAAELADRDRTVIAAFFCQDQDQDSSQNHATGNDPGQNGWRFFLDLPGSTFPDNIIRLVVIPSRDLSANTGGWQRPGQDGQFHDPEKTNNRQKGRHSF